jgi:EAL domain-containing protein (putative c-di-GMP-specific phosphodiesterase class I)
MSNAPNDWYLEGYAADSKSLWRFPLVDFPVRVGRRPGVGLSLMSPLISHDHAEIFIEQGTLKVRDLGSTNGTLVNGTRVAGGKAADLKEGDILHFASVEFRLGRLAAGESDILSQTTTALHLDMPRQMVDRARRFGGLLRDGAVVSVMQPIVNLQSGAIMGYELLGRGGATDLPQSPKELFDIAAALGVAAELSRMFRIVSAPLVRGMPGQPVLFFNTHPAELEKPGLIESLHALRKELPDDRLALEIHEQAVTSPDIVRELRSALTDLDIELAYDDFGAGRGRINELVEMPPEYLKFDESLIHDIDRAPAAKHELLRALVRICQQGDIQTLAEGVETEGEAQVLRDIGFELAQGYLFGKPGPIAAKA